MIKNDVPTSKLIGCAADAATLSGYIARALNSSSEKTLGHIKSIGGEDHSIRVFGQRPFEGSVSFQKALDPDEIAHELVGLADEQARYPYRHGIRDRKGWTIRKSADEDGNIFVGAYATWVPGEQ